MKLLTAAIMCLLSFATIANAACNVPSDTASDGSRCGGRAASERPGGK